jgi:hypothetical protein
METLNRQGGTLQTQRIIPYAHDAVYAAFSDPALRTALYAFSVSPASGQWDPTYGFRNLKIRRLLRQFVIR